MIQICTNWYYANFHIFATQNFEFYLTQTTSTKKFKENNLGIEVKQNLSECLLIESEPKMR